MHSLLDIKRVLLREHKKYEVPNASEYREGVLGGISVALMRIEQMIEEESNEQARYYGQQDDQ